MKAHFIASTVNLSEDIQTYRLITKTLKKHGIKLTDNWLEAANKRAVKDPRAENVSWQTIYRKNLEAITKSDIVIAEVGEKSFLVGFQVATALQMKKPILLLSRFAKVDSAIGVSLNEEIIKFSQYNEDTLDEVIGRFIDENSMGGKNIRFNFFIDRKLLNYLNWAALQTGEKKSEVIRKLIEKDMGKSDYR